MSTCITFAEMFPADVVSVQGKPYLFTNMRVDRKSLPDKFLAYDAADDSGDGECWRFQRHVLCDHWATIVGLEPLDLNETGQFWSEPRAHDPGSSREGIFIGFTMEDQSDYVVWYHSLKAYAKASQEQEVAI